MEKPYFQFEKDPLKHHVRTKLWLPYCKERLAAIRKKNKNRRLRYFTFCAAGAVDVFMLNVHRVLSTSTGDRFDNVTFFDQNQESVLETIKNIPGASGFPGNFTKVVNTLDDVSAYNAYTNEPLNPPESEPDTLDTEKKQIQLGQRNSFILRFPFDVINLDLEELIFKNNQEPPGLVINSLRKVLEWQKRPIKNEVLNEFTLFFTTQIGPRNLDNTYIENLISAVKSNVELNVEIKTAFKNRVSHDDAPKLFREDFDSFFRIAIPKILVQVLNEMDWHLDIDRGITIFEFERQASSGSYKMLHLGMHVRRLHPPKERRMPHTMPSGHAASYTNLVIKIFTEKPTTISIGDIDRKEIEEDLRKIFARRRLYSGEENDGP